MNGRAEEGIERLVLVLIYNKCCIPWDTASLLLRLQKRIAVGWRTAKIVPEIRLGVNG